MIGEILQAVLQETKTLLDGTGATVMLKTNFRPKSTPDNNGTLVLIDVEHAPDSVQYPGGLSLMVWHFGFNTYAWEPDAYVDDDSGYSAGLLDFIDTIRQHFTANYAGLNWLTTEMITVWDQYGFQYTLTGLTNADAIDQNGLIMGWKIGLDTTSFDDVTVFNSATTILQTVNAVMNSTLLKNFVLDVDSVMVVDADTLIQTIYLDQFGATAPTVGIGYTLGGNELFPPTVISSFTIIQVDQYYPAYGELYFSISGGMLSGKIDWLVTVLL
jgi:hypothetical protein